MATNPEDIILDYHWGSGTTMAIAHKMGRQYIGIEQMEYDENSLTNRLKHVIGIKNGDKFVDFDNKGMSKALN
jgi:adenine-specific DNA-methyltransferase